jgi:hypothetical protein
MAMRSFHKSVKSLMQFNWPYPGEPGDGLRDEIGILEWTRSGDVKFVGTELPNDGVVTDCPLFGYRCLQIGGGGGG